MKEQNISRQNNAIYQSSKRNWVMITILALVMAVGLSLISSAQAAPWNHAAAGQCFDRWGEITAERLNDYITGGDHEVPKLYRYNMYGEVVSTRVAVQVEPSNSYYHYENKYHWMWNHYFDNPYRWSNNLWQNAGVPHLRTFIRHCIHKYDESHWTRLSVKSAAMALDTVMSLERYLQFPPSGKHQSKKMFANPLYRGYRLSRCYAEDFECTGLKTAFHFCQSRGFAGVDDYRLKRSVGPTRHLRDSQLCTSPDCDGFAWIRCSGAKARSLQKISFI